MKLQQLRETLDHFLSYLKVEKNVSLHTQRAYSGDLEQFAFFWHNLEERTTREYVLSEVINKHDILNR